MNEPILLRRIRLSESQPATGKTRHYRGDFLLPSPSELRIVQYSNDPGFYLFYCDSTGLEYTDTYHDSISGAMSQAQWEFNIKEEDWEITKS